MRRRGRNTTKRKKPTAFVPGAYFLYTIPYGLYYITGAVVGYVNTNSFLCLLISGLLGVLLFLVGVGHFYEYRRGMVVEKIYLMLPLFVSMIVGIVMMAMYGLGGGQKFYPTGFVGIIGLISFLFYGYATHRDFGDYDNSIDDGRVIFNAMNYRDDPFLKSILTTYNDEEFNTLLSRQ